MMNFIHCTIISALFFSYWSGYFLSMGFHDAPFFLCKKKLFFPYSLFFSILPCHFYLFLQIIALPLNVTFFFLIQRISDFLISAFGFCLTFFSSPPSSFPYVYVSSLPTNQAFLFDNHLSLPQHNHALCIVPLLVYLSVLLISYSNFFSSLLFSYSAFFFFLLLIPSH